MIILVFITDDSQTYRGRQKRNNSDRNFKIHQPRFPRESKCARYITAAIVRLTKSVDIVNTTLHYVIQYYIHTNIYNLLNFIKQKQSERK